MQCTLANVEHTTVRKLLAQGAQAKLILCAYEIGASTWWAQQKWRVGRCGVCDKNNSFLAEKLLKLRFL
jgi:hypothetical protein